MRLSQISQVNRWRIAILLNAAFLLLPFLSLAPVYQDSEAREGTVVDEIMRTGEFILPLRNGEVIPSKPPLFHWLGASFTSLLGQNDAFTLRLPSALSALGLAFITFAFILELGGLLAATLGTAMLMTSYGFFRLGTDGRVDMLFAFLAVGAIAEWLRGATRALTAGTKLQDIPNSIYLRVGFLAGLAVFAKGPLGIAIPALVIISIALLEGGFPAVKSLLRIGWLLSILVPAPWYIVATLKGGTPFLDRQIMFENLDRFIGSSDINTKYSLYYLPHFIGQGAPWSLLFLLYILFLLRDEFRRRKEHRDHNRFLPIENLSRFGIRSGLVWIGILVLFFSISSGKRRAYLLPILPAIAMVLSLRFSASWRRLASERRPLHFLFRYELATWGGLFWLLTNVAVVSIVTTGGPTSPFWHENFPALATTISTIPAVIQQGGVLLLLILTCLSIASLTYWAYAFKRKSPLFAGIALFLLVEFGFVGFVAIGLAVKASTHTYVAVAKRISSVVPQTIDLTIVKSERDESFDALLFYLKRRYRRQDPSAPLETPGLYLAKRPWVSEHEPNPRIRKILSGNTPVNYLEDEVILFQLR